MRYMGAQGFTIVELTIATAVFSTVLLVGLTSFLGVGKIFYKGVTLSQTESTAQSILDGISSEIRFAPTVVTGPDGKGLTPSGTSSPSKYMCFGNVRYSFILYQQVDSSDGNKFGLLRDTLPGNSGCASSFGDGSTPLNDKAELLGNKMRLAKLEIKPAKNSTGAEIANLWSVSVVVAFGDDAVLQDSQTDNPKCNSGLQKSQFCSVARLTTSVSRGF